MARFSSAFLVGKFGAAQAGALVALRSGIDHSEVAERGPQRSILCERSYPALTSVEALGDAVKPIASALWQRLIEDCDVNVRLPVNLVATWRSGYEQPRSRSMPVPQKVLSGLRTVMAAGADPSSDGLGHDVVTSDESAIVEAILTATVAQV